MKRLTNAGPSHFQHQVLFLANASKPHHVGLQDSDDGGWSLHLGSVLLGTIDERTMKRNG